MKTYKIIIDLGSTCQPRSFIYMGSRPQAIAKGHAYISKHRLAVSSFYVREVL